MLKLEYLKILIFFIVALLFVLLLVFLSFLLNKDTNLINKKKPVECGSHLFGSGKYKIEVNFFIIAIIFVVFEVELLIIVPWLIFFVSTEHSLLVILIFIFILLLGLIFEYLSNGFTV